ncbi:hypothetical protein T4D_11870 [Trichinella pseudospiralis]|uniref:Uncharacterized protein n=1 Tax=Trichinella pseudospiralis TaxID=6337 RepID=A0A0V1FAF3_TRIPS|nr:hypothetical protein T4D_11870 [Trichinella pseudospiralis]
MQIVFVGKFVKKNYFFLMHYFQITRTLSIVWLLKTTLTRHDRRINKIDKNCLIHLTSIASCLTVCSDWLKRVKFLTVSIVADEQLLEALAKKWPSRSWY